MASQGKGSKIKGSSFERKIAKQFTEWWQNGGLQGEFYRTPASGGLRWVERSDVIGDICTPKGFTATIECKNSESWKYNELFTRTIARKPPLIKQGKNKGKPNSPRTIGEFWYQTCEEAVRANKIPILIFSKNYQRDLIVSPVSTMWNEIYKTEYKPWAVCSYFTFEELYYSHFSNTTIIRFDKFLEIVEPKMLINR